MRLLSILLIISFKCSAQYSEADVQTLAEALYFEARGENIQAIIEVAYVIKNRVESLRWPDTVYGVVYQPSFSSNKKACQFSYTCDGVKEIISKQDQMLYLILVTIARDVLNYGLESNFTGATHYLRCELSNRRKWVRGLSYVGKSGKHCFYR